jgi:hypothetical protein
MNTEGFIELLTYAALYTKSSGCKENNGPLDLPYIVSAAWKDNSTKHQLAETRAEVESSLLHISKSNERLGDPEMIAITADSFLAGLEEEDDVPVPGELSDRFSEGDLTVGEALVITVIDYATTETITRSIPYLIDDQGMPDYLEASTYRQHNGVLISPDVNMARAAVDGKEKQDSE